MLNATDEIRYSAFDKPVTVNTSHDPHPEYQPSRPAPTRHHHDQHPTCRAIPTTIRANRQRHRPGRHPPQPQTPHHHHPARHHLNHPNNLPLQPPSPRRPPTSLSHQPTRHRHL